MTTEQKFYAAVNVIRSLPKSGSFQPSNDLMLRFYSYFKQATEGPCDKPKPAFWEMINRAKWDSWKGLGSMSSEKAMEAYVYELQKIVETMSYTDNVAAFFSAVESDSTVPKADLMLVAGDIFRKAKSAPTTPTKGSRESSPHRSSSDHLTNGNTITNGSTITNGNTNGHQDSEDEYIDTVDSDESDIGYQQHLLMNGAAAGGGGLHNGGIPNGQVHHNGHAHAPNGAPPLHNAPPAGLANGHAALPALTHTQTHKTHTHDNSSRVLDELRRTVDCLEQDMAVLKGRVDAMEHDRAQLEKSLMWARPAWWPLRGVSPALLVALLLWPTVANHLTAALRRRAAQ